MGQLQSVVLAAGLGLAVASIQAQVPFDISPPEIVSPAQPAAATPAATTPATSAGTGHALDPADLEAFFDGIFPLQLERSDIAGATVMVMKDGNVLLEKGYGYADLKSKRVVDPNSTIFRLASISKSFTWVSVMQLKRQARSGYRCESLPGFSDTPGV
jgi:CubicO group peptidase (beta-lactamase class C family)